MAWSVIDSLWPKGLSLTLKQYVPIPKTSDLSSNPSSTIAGNTIWVNVATGVVVVITGITTITCVKSLISMILWQRALRQVSTSKRADGPRPIPLFGNTFSLSRNYYKTLYDYVDKPISVFWVLCTPFVVVNDEKCIRRVLGAGKGRNYMKPKYFGYRSKTVKTVVDLQNRKVAAESAEYTKDGDASRVALQKMIQDSFETISQTMINLLCAMNELSEREKLDKKQHETIHMVQKEVVGLNLNILFGLSTTSDKDLMKIGRMIIDAGREFARRMVNPLRVIYNLSGNIRYFLNVGGLVVLGRRLAKLLDLCAPENPDTNLSGVNWVHAWVGKVGRIGKLGKVIGLLMASTQTVPLTAVWMLHLVANDETAQNELANELKKLGIHSVSDLTLEKVEKMDFADAVIRETLRLYPPFPLIQRQAQADDILGDTRIPTGTIVYVVPWLIHRNPNYWKHPHEFYPMRFIKYSHRFGDAPSENVYIPFGRGPRMCAGYRLALIELKVLLAHAVLGYQWESHFTDGSIFGGIYPDLGMFPTGLRMSITRKVT